MENKVGYQSHLLILTMTILCCTGLTVATVKRCPNCGHIAVPYPLSTAADYGNQQYKVWCNAGALWLDALNSSSYLITSINPQTQHLIIWPPGLASKVTCMAADLKSQGIFLDDKLPFNITSSNTVISMNCSNDMLTLSLNCASNSMCHDYIRRNPVAASACERLPLCCLYKTGGSNNAYKIKVRKEGCSAYESFVNLYTSSSDLINWPEPGVEIMWELPQKPECKLPIDCGGLLNSLCLLDGIGQRRCLCKPGFQWDLINAICLNIKWPNRTLCKRKKGIAPLVGGLAFAIVAMVIRAIIPIRVYKRRDQNIKKAVHMSLAKFREDMLNSNNSSGKSAKIFIGKEIKKATNNFSKDNVLGSDGFGEVFKGVLDDGTITAVKRAKPGNTKGMDQILNEVRVLCEVNHKSLVRLIGCCLELE